MSTPSTVAVQAQLETNFNHSHTSTAAALADEPGRYLNTKNNLSCGVFSQVRFLASEIVYLEASLVLFCNTARMYLQTPL